MVWGQRRAPARPPAAALPAVYPSPCPAAWPAPYPAAYAAAKRGAQGGSLLPTWPECRETIADVAPGPGWLLGERGADVLPCRPVELAGECAEGGPGHGVNLPRGPGVRSPVGHLARHVDGPLPGGGVDTFAGHHARPGRPCIGTLVWLVCPSCRRGSINKISVSTGWPRRGLGRRLIRRGATRRARLHVGDERAVTRCDEVLPGPRRRGRSRFPERGTACPDTRPSSAQTARPARRRTPEPAAGRHLRRGYRRPSGRGPRPLRPGPLWCGCAQMSRWMMCSCPGAAAAPALMSSGRPVSSRMANTTRVAGQRSWLSFRRPPRGGSNCRCDPGEGEADARISLLVWTPLGVGFSPYSLRANQVDFYI